MTSNNQADLRHANAQLLHPQNHNPEEPHDKFQQPLDMDKQKRFKKFKKP